MRAAAFLTAIVCGFSPLLGGQIPQFRAGITLVPVDVYAVDKDGQPVTDLAASDFSVREDGQVEQISHFQPLPERSPSDGSRTFMVVLGRGHLNLPTKAIDALATFVRSLAPHDRIGVSAYLRVVKPTEDHVVVADFLEMYRDRHEAIEDHLIDKVGPGAAPLISTDARRRIDSIFQDSGLTSEDLSGGAGSVASRYTDFGYLRASLEYLRSIDGEKHLIVVSERPVATHAEDNPTQNYWIALAVAARTSLSFIHAGGLAGPAMSHGALSVGRGTSQLTSLLGNIETWDIAAQRTVAEETGGISAMFEFADKPLRQIDLATQAHYLLGYYPSSQVAATQFRQIDVEVKKPGVTIFYRHLYQAQAPPDEWNNYRQAVVAARIEAAAKAILAPALESDPMTPRRAVKWGMKLSASVPASSQSQLDVAVGFDPTWATFVASAGQHVAEIDLAVFADDDHNKSVGTKMTHLVIKLSDAEFERTKHEWLTYRVVVDVDRKPAEVRTVLYDFDADRTGSARDKVR